MRTERLHVPLPYSFASALMSCGQNCAASRTAAIELEVMVSHSNIVASFKDLSFAPSPPVCSLSPFHRRNVELKLKLQ